MVMPCIASRSSTGTGVHMYDVIPARFSFHFISFPIHSFRNHQPASTNVFDKSTLTMCIGRYVYA